MQQQAVLNRNHQSQYLQDLHQQAQNLQNPVIAPSYLQQALSSSSVPGAHSQQQDYTTSNPIMSRVEDSFAGGDIDPSMDDIEDDDDEEEDDAEEESSADEHSSFGEEGALQEEASASHGRKRRRKPGTTQIARPNGSGNSKRIKAEDPGHAANAKGNRKGKAKIEALNSEVDSKSKSTRGSKACTVCRRLKMRCEPAADGDESKCKRCRAGGHECVFEESQRGRRKNQKTDAMAKSIKNMESTLETVLKAIATGNAHTVAGMSLGSDGNLVATSGSQQPQATTISPPQTSTPSLNIPPLPSIDPSLSNTTYPGSGGGSSIPHHTKEQDPRSLGQSDGYARPAGQGVFNIKTEETLMNGNAHGSSPALRLHSLPEPENTWAPLGLLAEASLENNQSKGRRSTFTASDLPHNLSALEEIRQARAQVDSDEKNVDGNKLGVANDAYFQPGPFNSKPSHASSSHVLRA